MHATLSYYYSILESLVVGILTPPAQNLPDFMNANLGQLQTLIQLAALLNPTSAPVMPQQPQLSQPPLPSQPTTQNAPNLLSILGLAPNSADGFVTSRLMTFWLFP